MFDDHNSRKARKGEGGGASRIAPAPNPHRTHAPTLQNARPPGLRDGVGTEILRATIQTRSLSLRAWGRRRAPVRGVGVVRVAACAARERKGGLGRARFSLSHWRHDSGWYQQKAAPSAAALQPLPPAPDRQAERRGGCALLIERGESGERERLV